jgi:hypothetical protein
MRPTGPADRLVVATTSAEYLAATGRGPADAVWLRPGARHRDRLFDLGRWWQR